MIYQTQNFYFRMFRFRVKVPTSLLQDRWPLSK